MAQTIRATTPDPDYVESGKFADVKAAELQFIVPEADPANLCGLALSGGGIRSASFALGVLQALHGFKVFDKFDYLSTVSGGGYIGSALTYFRNYFSRTLKPRWFPFGYLNADVKVRGIGVRTEKPKDPGDLSAYQVVSYLRQHASFLTPSRKLDRPALAAGVLRGLFSSVLPYMAILVGILGFCLAAGLFDHRINFNGSSFGIALDSLSKTDKGEKSPYLALLPTCFLLTLLGVTLLGSLFQVLRSSYASRGTENNPQAVKGYYGGIECLHFHGGLLIAAAVILLVSALPWLYDYLAGLGGGKGSLPTTVGALFAALIGAAAQIGKLQAIVGGVVRPPSATKSILMVVAGIALVFGVVFLAYIVGFKIAFASCDALNGWTSFLPAFLEPYSRQLTAVVWPLVCGAVGLGLGIFINVNHASQHRIYRDRLMEVFCAEEEALEKCEWRPAKWAQTDEGYLHAMKAVPRPLHLINATMIATDSDDRRFRGRGGDNFLLSPVFCGSDATGWIKTTKGMTSLSIATAAAVSGAALNAHAGPHGSGGLRNKAYAALLSFLGLNLGYWARNPREYADASKPPRFKMPSLIEPGLRNISGRSLDEHGPYVLLSDGGHFENLALYELIRREVKLLWISDAGQDTKLSFEDLSCAIERVRVDFGVNIRFHHDDYDLAHLLPGSAETNGKASERFAEEYKPAHRGYAIGKIEYPNQTTGIVVYIKPTLTRNLPGDIYGYRARNKDFPHQTTMDQFFDEEQFEAYRELGYRLSKELITDIASAGKKETTSPNEKMPPALREVTRALGIKFDAAGNIVRA